jgi:hypothetical protein
VIPPEICIPGTNECLNCTLLKDSIDQFSNLVCDCIIEAENGVFINRTYNHGNKNDVIYTLPPSNFPEQKIAAGITDVFVTFLFNAINLVLNVIISLFTSNYTFSVVNVIDSGATFFANTNVSDPYGFFYYAYFLIHCDFENQTSCYIGRPGIGFNKAIWLIPVINLGVIVVLGSAFPASNAIISYILILIPIEVIAAAYFWSPWCFLYPPTLPRCLADDVAVFLNQFDVPCFDLDSVFPNLTTTICPGPSTNYQRSFPDCAAEPYDFENPLRTLTFIFQWKLPSVNNFLSTTNIFGLSFLRTFLPLDFDFPPGDPSQQFLNCFYLTFSNFVLLGVIFTGLALLAIPIILAIYVLFYILIAILAFLSLFLTLLLVIVGGPFLNPNNRKYYYVDSSEIGTMNTVPNPGEIQNARNYNRNMSNLRNRNNNSTTIASTPMYNREKEEETININEEHGTEEPSRKKKSFLFSYSKKKQP